MGAVVQTLKDTGSVLVFVMIRGRFMFRIRGPWSEREKGREGEGSKKKKKRRTIESK